MGLVGKTLGIIAFATIVASCSLSHSSGVLPVVKQCILPQDQTGTMSGKWRLTPIPVAFHQGSNFSDQEIGTAMELVDEALQKGEESGYIVQERDTSKVIPFLPNPFILVRPNEQTIVWDF